MAYSSYSIGIREVLDMYPHLVSEHFVDSNNIKIRLLMARAMWHEHEISSYINNRKERDKIDVLLSSFGVKLRKNRLNQIFQEVHVDQEGNDRWFHLHDKFRKQVEDEIKTLPKSQASP